MFIVCSWPKDYDNNPLENDTCTGVEKWGKTNPKQGYKKKTK